MKVNFFIKDNRVLEMAERQIDLNINFDYVGFDYNVTDREIKLYWKNQKATGLIDLNIQV